MQKHKITLELDSYQISLISDWIGMAAENLRDQRSEWGEDDEFELSNQIIYGTTDYDEAQGKLEDILSQLEDALPLSEKTRQEMEELTLSLGAESLLLKKIKRFEALRDSFNLKALRAERAMFRSTDPNDITKHGSRWQRYQLATERAEYYYLKLLGEDPDFPHPWALSTDELKSAIAFLRDLNILGDTPPMRLTYYTPA
jgi:hypothetical protein